MNTIQAGGEPFYFEGGHTGCLLIHGFTGTPREMRPLGEHLAGRGHSVLCPRLFGHATRPEDMLRARRADWAASVEDGYHLLRGRADRLVAIGLSLGAVLALLLARRAPLAGVVSLSAPFDPPDARMRPLRPIAPLLTPFWRFAPKAAPDWHDPQAAVGHLEYPVNPVRAAVELHDLLAELRQAAPSIAIPALVIHSRGDGLVAPAHAETLLDRLGSADKQLIWVERSGHVVTCDAARETVFAAVAAFVERVTGGA